MALPPGMDLRDVPLKSPPAGIKSNFVNPQSLGNVFLIVSLTLMVVGTLFAMIRVWSNRHKLRLSDIFIVAAVVFSIGWSLSCFPKIQFYRHSWDIRLVGYAQSHAQTFFAQSILFGPTMFFGKEAMLLLYFEIFHVKKGMKYAIVSTMTFTALVFVSVLVICPIFCAPHVGETWNILENPKVLQRCMEARWYSIVLGICDLLIEVVIFVIPIPAVLQLQLSRRQKIQILAVFMTAGLAVAASVVENFYRIRYNLDPSDPAWCESKFGIWCVVEIWTTIIVACLPAFAAFCRLQIQESRTCTRMLLRPMAWSNISTKQSQTAATTQPSREKPPHRTPIPDLEVPRMEAYHKLEGRIGTAVSYDVETLEIDPHNPESDWV